MSYRGGRGGRGRGRGRGSGRGRGRGHGHGHGSPNDVTGKPLFQPCRNYMTSNNCQHGANCSFKHVVQMHKNITNSDPEPQQQNNNNNNYNNYNDRGYDNQSNYNNRNKLHPTTDVALWNDQSSGALKIFTASHDKNWRLYNTSTGFSKEIQHDMGGKINSILVESNFLFCGFEAKALKVPAVDAGMIFAWNLGNPGDAPVEFHMHPTAPYAHAGGVTCLITKGDMCISGGRDCAIRIWKYDATLNAPKGGFKLIKTLHGHLGEITGLVIVGTMLWSCSTDITIRLWDSNADWDCKFLIPQGGAQDNTATSGTPQSGPAPTGAGHTDALTDLLHYKSQLGDFVLSSSLDGKVKVWNSTNGECVTTTDNGVGIISMALSSDSKGAEILICGTAYGTVMLRSLQQTASTPAMAFLCTLDKNYCGCGHDGPVKRVIAGPSNTFYTAGDDGNLVVWQFTGSFDL
jgi:WD40 repeat protein